MRVITFCALILCVNAQQTGENMDLTQLIELLTQINIQEICDTIKLIERDDICFQQLKMVCDNETFLNRMLDASSKFPYSGMLVKTRLDLGSYDECVQLDMTVNNWRVLGKHCLAGLVIPVTNDTTALDEAFKLSTCIPDQCTAMDLLDIANSTSLYPFFNDFSCKTKDTNKKLGWDDYVAIVFFTLTLLIMTASTIYDMYFYYNNIDCPNKLLQAFSVLHNGQKLLKLSEASSDEIQAIHGIRVISMMWIVISHSFGSMVFTPGYDLEYKLSFEWSRKSTYVTTSNLAVDTFFFISGFLLAYHYLKGKPTSFLNHLRRVPSMIIHRYVRITPVVAPIFLLTVTLFMHMGDGPLYHIVVQMEKDKCVKYWWTYFLYLQNYVNYKDLCVPNTWYLSADWQMFMLSPIIFIPVAMLVKSNFKWVILHLLLINLSFIFIPMGIKLLMKYHDNNFETHIHLTGYFIGFMFGVYMRERNGVKHRISPVSNVLIWACALFTFAITTVVFQEILILAHSKNDKRYHAYLILLRSLWSIPLAWTIYACHHGYGGFINWMLTTPLVRIVSKLTYCMYILHVSTAIYLNLIIRAPIEYSQFTAWKDAIVTYMATMVVSVGWTLAFESPLITIEKYFLSPRK